MQKKIDISLTNKDNPEITSKTRKTVKLVEHGLTKEASHTKPNIKPNMRRAAHEADITPTTSTNNTQ